MAETLTPVPEAINVNATPEPAPRGAVGEAAQGKSEIELLELAAISVDTPVRVGPEAWANFRRSDFPVLSPNNFPGKDLKTESFIRRLTYTDAELNVNKKNVEAAIAKQGPNVMDTRVWWDKK